jgi:hypothetical protein
MAGRERGRAGPRRELEPLRGTGAACRASRTGLGWTAAQALAKSVPLAIRLRRHSASVRRSRGGRRLASLLLAVGASLAFVSSAEAAPSCPDVEVSTPYQTPVTVTLACTDPEYPIVGYYLLGSPPTALPGNTTTFTPQPGFSGRTLAFWYQGSNSIGASDFGIVYVTVGPKPAPPPAPPNRPPVARCDFYNVKLGQHLRVPKEKGLLANDSDPEGGTLLVIPQSTIDAFRPQLNGNGSFAFSAPNKPMVLSFSYEVVDDPGAVSEGTLTIAVGRRVNGCRAASEPPPIGPNTFTATLRKVSGSVRVRAGRRWRTLGGALRLTRPVMVDTRGGSVRVRATRENNYEREVSVGRFGGGAFNLGKKLGAITSFTTLELAGPMACRGASGPGRRLDVVAPPGFWIDALRLRVYNWYVRNRPVVSRYTVADRCNQTSSVVSRAGRVHVRNRNTGEFKILKPKQTYVARAKHERHR